LGPSHNIHLGALTSAIQINRIPVYRQWLTKEQYKGLQSGASIIQITTLNYEIKPYIQSDDT